MSITEWVTDKLREEVARLKAENEELLELLTNGASGHCPSTRFKSYFGHRRCVMYLPRDDYYKGTCKREQEEKIQCWEEYFKFNRENPVKK